MLLIEVDYDKYFLRFVEFHELKRRKWTLKLVGSSQVRNRLSDSTLPVTLVCCKRCLE